MSAWEILFPTDATCVKLLSTVPSLVSGQRPLVSVAFLAGTAGIGPLASVGPFVLDQMLTPDKAFAAHPAHVVLCVTVKPCLVPDQVVVLSEPLPTDAADVELAASAQPLVLHQVIFLGKPLVAPATHVRLAAGRHSDVSEQAVLVTEALVAGDAGVHRHCVASFLLVSTAAMLNKLPARLDVFVLNGTLPSAAQV